jgi:uncharacterized protein (TIGR02453 family)
VGWPADALRFYEELAADNSKRFFDANRRRYEEHVRAPLERLLDAAFDEFGDAKVFRPNRDIRFSRDKSPYKLSCYAVVGDGYYVAFSADGLVAGGGMYDPTRDQLTRYRAAVDAERSGEALRAITAALPVPLAPPDLARGPRGMDPAHPRAELLRHRNVIAMERWAPAPWLATAEADRRVLATWRAIRPLVTWLAAHVGPPESPARTTGAERPGR